MKTNESDNSKDLEVNQNKPSYIQTTRTIIGGASLGAVAGGLFGFVGSAIGASVGSIIIPFLLLQNDPKVNSEETNSLEENNES